MTRTLNFICTRVPASEEWPRFRTRKSRLFIRTSGFEKPVRRAASSTKTIFYWTK